MTKGPPPNHHGPILFPDGFSSVFDIEGNESVTQYNRLLRIHSKFAMNVLYQNNFIVTKSSVIFYVDFTTW